MYFENLSTNMPQIIYTRYTNYELNILTHCFSPSKNCLLYFFFTCNIN